MFSIWHFQWQEQLFSDLLWSDPTEHEGKYKLLWLAWADEWDRFSCVRAAGQTVAWE